MTTTELYSENMSRSHLKIISMCTKLELSSWMQIMVSHIVAFTTAILDRTISEIHLTFFHVMYINIRKPIN